MLVSIHIKLRVLLFLYYLLTFGKIFLKILIIEIGNYNFSYKNFISMMFIIIDYEYGKVAGK